LRRQHQLLRERRFRTDVLLRAIELEMEVRKMGIALTPEEQFELFGTDRFGGELAGEAEETWGETQPWKESHRRVAAFTKDDWLAIRAEVDANEHGFTVAMSAGEPAAGIAAMDLAEAHRQHLRRWFYDCDPDMHRALAELYVSDRRFAVHYDEKRPGLAQYVHDAIVANAQR
jgi:hypothetical protein